MTSLKWNDDKFVAADFETSGEYPEYALQPWRILQGKAWATSLVWVRKVPGSLKIDGGLLPDRETIRRCLVEAAEAKRTIVGWNLVYDIAVFLAYGLEEEVFACNWLDGMLLWRHAVIEPEYETDKGKKKSYGLKAAVAEFLPDHAGYEEGVDFHSTDPEEMKKLHSYNIRDNVFALRITKLLWGFLEASDPRRLRAALIEAKSLPFAAQANLAGMLVDRVAARELEQTLVDDAARALEALAPHGVTETVVRSPLKLAKLLYDDWGLQVLKENTGKKTGKVSRATDKEVLHELAFADPRAKTLREYREALNNRTKFAEAPLISSAYNGDLRTHPEAHVFGTYSGRLTYSSNQTQRKDRGDGRVTLHKFQTGFALHQEKRGANFRGIIIAEPGYDLVEFDASGQEFRWMAIASGDQTMLNLCLPGEDAHTYMGARIAGMDYRTMQALLNEGDANAKDKRQLGKVGNLSLQYRTSHKKLRVVARVQYNIPMELPEAKYIWITYQQTYPGVPEYWKVQINLTKATGYVETFAGRRVQVVGDWDGSFGWSMASTAINYRIQGTGADQKYLALSVLGPYLRKMGARFAWDLHDGIYFWVPKQNTQRFAREARWILNNLPYKKAWGFTPPIPLPWDCKIGTSWGNLKELKD